MPDTAVADRTLPHNLEAERSVLGAILLHNDAFNLAAEVIDSADFFRDAHRRIFDKMVKLVERGDAVDLITLKEELNRSNELDEVGGPAYIAALVDGVPRSTNVEHYAKIIKEKSTLRSLIFSANKIITNAYNAEEEADTILDQAESAIFKIADSKIRDGFVSLRELAHSSLDTIEKLHARKELITGVPTGFVDLDEMTSGLQSSDLVIVAARPSMGKTSLVLNIAQHVGTKTDMTVGVFSLEMSKEQLFLRMLTGEARIDAHRLRGGFLGERDWGRLSEAIGTLSEAKIFIDDTPSIGVLEMRAKCRRLKAEHDLHLVIIDYVQLMQGRGRFENRTLELASISRSLKGLAKELGVPIIVLSQLSRAPESRSDHRPQLSDLRECVTGGTLVALTDGRRVPIRDLVGTQPSVWALSEERTLQPALSDKVWHVGQRHVATVRLASGRSIKATAKHRLLTGRGWTEVGSMAVGDHVAVANRISAPLDASGATRSSHKPSVEPSGAGTSAAAVLDRPAQSIPALTDESSDLIWDPVVSIEPAGVEDVYDLTVPGPANWLADGIVTHNSGALEQDADVVIFIYREDVYADKNAPPTDAQGTAELIIGKQRNGPTGVVKLAFIREFTRFENLAVGGN